MLLGAYEAYKGAAAAEGIREGFGTFLAAGSLFNDIIEMPKDLHRCFYNN